jgi:hypothetical protein
MGGCLPSHEQPRHDSLAPIMPSLMRRRHTSWSGMREPPEPWRARHTSAGRLPSTLVRCPASPPVRRRAGSGASLESSAQVQKATDIRRTAGRVKLIFGDARLQHQVATEHPVHAQMGFNNTFVEDRNGALIMASATRRRPLDHATALQHRRQGAGEDADVMLRGPKRPRQYVRPTISPSVVAW